MSELFKGLLVLVLILIFTGCEEDSNDELIFKVDIQSLDDCEELSQICPSGATCTIFPNVGPKCHSEPLGEIVGCSEGFSIVELESNPIQVRCEKFNAIFNE